MNANKELWEQGDFTRIATTMRDSGAALVKELGITNSMQVLDLGSGDGTTALPTARLGAEVLGVDIAANLVEAGNRRAEDHGLTNLRFEEGDASDLFELADESFDLVVSIFGAMFAPEPSVRGPGDGAGHASRRTDRDGELDPRRPDAGGADPPHQRRILAAAARGLREPDDVGGGGRGGGAVHRRRRAGPAHLCARDTYTFVAPVPPAKLLAEFRDYYGPTMNAFKAAEAEGRADALWHELEELFTAQNTIATGETTAIPATFLRVTVDVDDV